VIIGGGCMGASTAFHLARRGITDVVLVEREPHLGSASTGRNAGGVRHQFAAEANVRLSLESIRAMERFRDEVGADLDFHQDGYLFLLSTEASVGAFRAGVELQRRLGVEVDLLGPGDVARLAPGVAVDGVRAATFCARDGIADPGGLTSGYAGAARRAGVEIALGVEATAVRTDRERVVGVETTAGTVATPAVVNAAGPWARIVGRMAGIDVPVEPLRRHIFIARDQGGASWDEAARAGRVPTSRVMVIDFETSFYFHREGGGLLFGMGDPEERSGFDTTVRWDFLPQVIDAAARRLPALLDAEVSHAWAGLYEMTPDRMPVIGPTAVEGYYVVAGFSGHGFQHSPAAGRVVADLIAGRDPGLDLAPFAWARFERGSAQAEAHVV
jgi:sarcosine oxidase subunit beta